MIVCHLLLLYLDLLHLFGYHCLLIEFQVRVVLVNGKKILGREKEKRILGREKGVKEIVREKKMDFLLRKGTDWITQRIRKTDPRYHHPQRSLPGSSQGRI